MAIEFATGYVSLIPSLKGAGKSISSQLGSVNMAPIGAKMGAKLGAKMGGGIKASFGSQISASIMAPVEAALERQSTATRNLGTAERDLTKARSGQQTAQAKVLKAEEKLERLRASGTASSGDLKVAEAELNAAKVALADSNLKVGSSEDAATRAKESATKANSAYIESLKKSSTVSGRLETALPIIGERIQNVGAQFKTAGAKIGGVGKSMTAKITAPVGVAVTAVGGLVGALGFGRLKGMDAAKAQLEGLGYSTKDVGRISAQVTSAIEGGMTTMAEGTAVAAGALAAGVGEGKELEGYIKRVGNAAVGANRPVGEMSQIFNRVQGSGKLMTMELNMIEQGMPGFATAMAKSLGVPQDEFRKMVTEGKVSSKQFMGVMDDFAGGMAEAQSKSWDGMVKNTLAYVGIIGESLLGGIFGDAKTAIGDFQEYLKSDDVQAWAADMGAKIGETFSRIVTAVRGAITWWQALNPTVKSAIVGFAGFLVVAGPVLMVVGKIVSVIGGLISGVGLIVSTVGRAIPVLKALNAVMRANVIGIVVTAIAALVAGLIWFFTQTELGQEIWGGFVNFLKDVWEGFSTFLMEAWTNITTFISGALANIGNFFTGFGASVSSTWVETWSSVGDFFRGFWEGLKSFIGAGIEFIKGLFFKFHPLGIVIANWQPIVAFVTGLFATVKGAISTALGAIRAVITNITNGIRNVWNSVWGAIKAFVVATFSAVRSAVSGAMGGIRSVVVSMVNGIRNAWNAGWNAVKAGFVAVVRGIVSAVTGFVSSVKSRFSDVLSFVRAIPGKLIGFFSGMGSKLVASGRALIGGFLDGIMAGFNKAKDAVAGGLSKIRGLFPFSPAKEGPFSGRGWVAYSGLSLGATFSQTVADSLNDGRKDISDELGGIQDEFDDFNNDGFRVSASVPDYEVGAAAGTAGSMVGGTAGPLINIEHMTVDSDVRVKQISQDLWDRSNRANRSRGKVALGGVVV